MVIEERLKKYKDNLQSFYKKAGWNFDEIDDAFYDYENPIINDKENVKNENQDAVRTT